MVAAQGSQAGDGGDGLDQPESGREAFEALKASGGLDAVLSKIDAGQLRLTLSRAFLMSQRESTSTKDSHVRAIAHDSHLASTDIFRNIPN
jgi:putative transposase